MRFTMLGRRGQIKLARLKNIHGDCDRPTDSRTAVIRLGQHLRGKKELEILLHELNHFADFTKDEECIEDVSRVMADVLWRWGYRKHGRGKT